MPGKKKFDKVTTSGLSQLNLWDEKHDQQWQEFKVAREYIRSLKLTGKPEWKEFIKKKEFQRINIPANPEQVYKHQGWKDWHDWLGVGDEIIRSRNQSSDHNLMNNLWATDARLKWMNFFEARQIVWEYGFKYQEEWKLFTEGKFPARKALPGNIPENPDQVYRFVGWKGWKDWLISPDNRIEYTEFYTARDFVRSNRIPDKGSWRDFLQQKSGLTGNYHMKLPVRPHLEYSQSGWKSWEDWLGTEIAYHDFKSTRNYIRSLKLRNKKDWNDFIHGHLTHKPKRTENIFAYPEIAYRYEGWSGWEDWLGTECPEESGSTVSELPEGTKECICKGILINCPECDGKGYYYV